MLKIARQFNSLSLEAKKELILWLLVENQDLIDEVKEERSADLRVAQLERENDELKEKLRLMDAEYEPVGDGTLNWPDANPAKTIAAELREKIGPKAKRTVVGQPPNPADSSRVRRARLPKAAKPQDKGPDTRELKSVNVTEQLRVRTEYGRLSTQGLQSLVMGRSKTPPWKKEIASQILVKREPEPPIATPTQEE